MEETAQYAKGIEFTNSVSNFFLIIQFYANGTTRNMGLFQLMSGADRIFQTEYTFLQFRLKLETCVK